MTSSFSCARHAHLPISHLAVKSSTQRPGTSLAATVAQQHHESPLPLPLPRTEPTETWQHQYSSDIATADKQTAVLPAPPKHMSWCHSKEAVASHAGTPNLSSLARRCADDGPVPSTQLRREAPEHRACGVQPPCLLLGARHGSAL